MLNWYEHLALIYHQNMKYDRNIGQGSRVDLLKLIDIMKYTTNKYLPDAPDDIDIVEVNGIIDVLKKHGFIEEGVYSCFTHITEEGETYLYRKTPPKPDEIQYLNGDVEIVNPDCINTPIRVRQRVSWNKRKIYNISEERINEFKNLQK